MSDDKLNLEIGVQVTSEGTEKAEHLRKEFELLNREVLASARAIKESFAALNSFSGRGRSAGSPATEQAQAGRDALTVQGDLYAQLRKRLTFERRMSAQRTREEADAARQAREQQAETARQFREQMQFNTRMARQRAQAEAEAERETRREIIETGRMRDRQNKQAIADAKALERAQAKAAAGVARGAGQVRSGAGRAIVAGGATAGVVGYAAKRGLDALTRSGVDIDTAMAKNARLETGVSPEQARAKIEGVRQNYQPLARRLGISVAELLNTRSESLQAGVDQSIVDRLVEDATKFAILNDMKPSEVAESSGYGLTALSAFGKVDAARASRLFNLQQHLAQTTSASRQGLASFVRRGLAAGASAGFSDQDTLAYGAAGTSAGQDGESVARMLSSTTERIASAPTRAADIARRKHKTIANRLFLSLPKRLGFRDWKDLKARFSADSAQTMEQIYEGLSQIHDPRERLETSEEIFGKQFGAAHSAMAAGHLFKNMRQSVRSGDAGTALDRGISIMDGAFGQIMRQIGVTISELTNDLGLELKPYWADLRDWALRTPKAFKSFTEAFRSGLKGFVTGLGSPDGTMAGLLTKMFGDPSAFSVDAGMIGQFAQGVGQGLRDVGSAIVSFVKIFAGSDASPREIGRWTARLLGWSAALLVAAPAVAVLTGLGTAIAGFARIVMSTYGLMKAAGLVGAAAGTPKVPANPGAAASAGWLARFGQLFRMFGGAVGFNATAGLPKADQDALIGRLGAYAQEMERKQREGRSTWVDPPIRKPVEQLQQRLEQNTEALRDGAKVQKQAYEAIEGADFRSLIHKASIGSAASSIPDSIRSTAARAGGGVLSGSIGGGNGLGPAIASSIPGGSLGNGPTGMRRRGIIGGGSGGVGSVRGNGVTNPRLAGDVAARAKQAHDFFRAQGYSEEATAGILASLSKESNFTPNARGDGGSAHGIAQWHRDRRAQILAGTGIDVATASFQDQLRAVDWEMRHGDAGAQRARRALMTPGISARDAGSAFVYNFERPKRDERAERGALAEGFYRQFGGGGGAVASGKGGRSVPYLSGQIDVEGQKFDFGSGNGKGKNSIPFGTYPVTPDAIGSWGRQHGAVGINGNRIWDQTLNRFREGIEFHASTNAQKLTAGCVGIAREQWGAFKDRMLTVYRRAGKAFLTVGPNGASITADRPEDPSAQVAAHAKRSQELGAQIAKPNLGSLDITPHGGALGGKQPLGDKTPIKSGSTGGRGAGGQGGGNSIHAPINIVSHGGDAQEIANRVQRHINDSMNRRSHDFDQTWA